MIFLFFSCCSDKITLMSLIGKLNYAGEKTTVDILSQRWNSVANTIEIFEGRQLDILSEFLWKLFSATKPEQIQDDIFFTVRYAILTIARPNKVDRV